MNQDTIHIIQTDLASRSLAIPVRQRVSALIAEGKLVTIDLICVKSISASYADEMFGVLVRDFGLELVTSQLNIINASDAVLKSIAEAMYVRSQKNLVAA
tara:strand:- start:24382 stop:24681 length:300 start_codon:yes stop_codon:yes gene_type:complete